MISRNAVENFLKAKTDDWTWMKDLSKDILLETVKKEVGDFQFKTELYKHQLVCVLLGLDREFLFFLDMGGGKTFISLFLIGYFKSKKNIKKSLVIVPNEVLIESWNAEIKKHTDLSMIGLTGTEIERRERLKQDADVYVINYAGLQVLMADLQEVKTKKNQKKKKRQRVLNPVKARQFINNFDLVVFDEIHLCRNKNSLTYKLCNEISKKVEYRYGLTGTPIGRDAVVLWPQFYLIDRGETLGQTISIFRESYFNIKQNFWGGYEYKLKKELKDHLHNRLNHKSIRYTEEELTELPKRVEVVVPLNLSEEAKTYYNQAVQGVIEAHKFNKQQIENAFIMLRKISAGFVSFKDEDEDQVEIVIKENQKIEAMIDIISNTPKNSKVVVFNEFIKSGDLICERLKKEKIKFERLYGGTKDKKKVLNNFLNKKDIKVFVVNTQSGSTGLNLQIANYCIIYESPCSPIVRKQMEKRLHRDGQKKKVFLYDLVIKNSVDERILGFIKEGKDLFQHLIDGKDTLTSFFIK